MNLNKKEIKKILYEFNSISNRLLQADFQDHTAAIDRFVAFIKSTPVIYDYVLYCSEQIEGVDEEFDTVLKSSGRYIFSLGKTTEEEIGIIFRLLELISNKQIDIAYTIGASYSSSTKYQDRTKAFNDRVVLILINDIEGYLTKIGIDMGLDEKMEYSISVHNGQVNIANDHATIEAVNTIGIDTEKLTELLNAIRASSVSVSENDKADLTESLEVIETEVQSSKPRRSFLNTAMKTLSAIKGTAEFAAAVAALIQFVQPMLP